MRIKYLYLVFLLFLQLPTRGQESMEVLRQKALEIIRQLTLTEKVAMLQYTQPGIPRLQIPAYNFWNEALHGVARNGTATVFPQAIGMAATWNPALIRQAADVVATEARAKFHEGMRTNGFSNQYAGLSFWSPNINIFRDPRWGRGQETWGEDPFLTGEMGLAYVEGLQGKDPVYLKTAAAAKHFAVHSGPESNRHSFNAEPPVRDLYETYLPAFEKLVKQGRVEAVMCAYNRLYKEPCCASSQLLQTILRRQWAFRGHIVTDCWAISDMVGFHHRFSSQTEAAAESLKAGTDLSCGPEMGALNEALAQKLVEERDIDSALYRLVLTRLRLGIMTSSDYSPYSNIPFTQNNHPAHGKLAEELAAEGMVLLKNEGGLLPIGKKYKTIAAIGPFISDTAVLLGNYNGTPLQPVSFVEGLKKGLGKNQQLLYSQGILKPWEKYANTAQAVAMHAEAMRQAGQADLIIFFAGISARLEGEDGDVTAGVPGFYKGDRTHIDLPADQRQTLQQIWALGKPVILVLTGGSALGLEWEKKHIPAIMMSWYPGEAGGTALANLLTGRQNPSGKLPVSFYHSINDLPDFEDYSMKGRTYRYFGKPLLYPFGHGLSYTRFEYSGLKTGQTSYRIWDSIRVECSIKNTGLKDGREVVQLYISKKDDSTRSFPIQSLQGFQKILVRKGRSAKIRFSLGRDNLRYYDPGKNGYLVAPGAYEIRLGSSSEDIRLRTTIHISGE